MLRELLKTLEKELKLLGGSRTSVYTDLDSDQVGVVGTILPELQRPCLTQISTNDKTA